MKENRFSLSFIAAPSCQTRRRAQQANRYLVLRTCWDGLPDGLRIKAERSSVLRVLRVVPQMQSPLSGGAKTLEEQMFSEKGRMFPIFDLRHVAAAFRGV